MQLYKRNLEVLVGTAERSVVVKSPLTIRATVVKDIKTGEKDYAQVTLFNLKKGTRDLLNEPYQKVQIAGGYGDQKDIIFIGNVVAATHKHEGTEWVTTLECGDGAKTLDKALINKTYGKGFKLGDLLRDFASTSGVALDDIIGINESAALSRGKVFSSDLQTALNDLARAHDFNWSIQDEKLIIVDRGQYRAKGVRLISARTGMVGSPEWINSGSEEKAVTKKTTSKEKAKPKPGQRFKVTSLCIPSLKPADLILVETGSLQGRMGTYVYDVEKDNFRGEFAVSKVQHDLDNIQGNFITQIECTPVKGLS